MVDDPARTSALQIDWFFILNLVGRRRNAVSARSTNLEEKWRGNRYNTTAGQIRLPNRR
jgi:hypothetical protein